MDFIHEKERIYLENESGECIAEITFPSVSEDMVNVNHTYVDKSLRGQGVADKLMTSLVKDLKKNSRKAAATCSYAVDWFEKHPEHKDIYIEKN
ncbi:MULTISPECIES: GNAT family N-acetyltransferase [unclassified Sedimentibacter]|uniref:GNAT family N-acetyltransferase n=1 Tax=unclassified Sedimentibacter TaxID=2649220 RepID=UPI0027DFF761|nr:GNAT family N-acetyltransferase [Sedimentibacter sp. MB35-C1]WMJ77395.1 GNAT family N-acetyltransferase [Sedimentibacter sp. MB35-C1]